MKASTIIPALLVLLLAGCGKDKKSTNFNGTWESAQWGVMSLQQTGTRVTGTWEFQNGQLDGTVAAGKLTFKWWQNVDPGSPYDSADNANRGNGYFILAKDAQTFAGKWRFHGREKWEDAWDAIRVLDRK